jgi:5-methylcytosine-specific restriction endonuclease McrA
VRNEFPDKIKFAAWQRAQGYCENALCQAKLWTGKFQYDHAIACELGGDASLGNCQVLCLVCHDEKTRNDKGNIAEAHHRERKHAGIRSTKWRPLPGTKRSGIRIRMNKTVERW